MKLSVLIYTHQTSLRKVIDKPIFFVITVSFFRNFDHFVAQSFFNIFLRFIMIDLKLHIFSYLFSNLILIQRVRLSCRHSILCHWFRILINFCNFHGFLLDFSFLWRLLFILRLLLLCINWSSFWLSHNWL